jgi:hypothetical protein
MARQICLESWLIILYLVLLTFVVWWVWNQAPTETQSTRTVVVKQAEPTRVVQDSGINMPVPINVPTRGAYGGFKLIGYLQPEPNRNDAKSVWIDQESDALDDSRELPDRPMLRLYGRRIDSNRYEYYTTNHNDVAIKIALHVPRDQELFDGDGVGVAGYGPYRVVTYQPMYPSFLPQF